MARVAINGLGRIGRATLRSLVDTPELDLVAVNDIVDLDDVAYLLRYDSVYGRFPERIECVDSTLRIGERSIAFSNEQRPADLPWSDHDVDLVFECSGVFRHRADLADHLAAGARRVIVSAPGKDEMTTVVHGVNTEDGLGEEIVSCASCTTNCIAPVIEILERRIGVAKATMTTVHAYTASQELVDGPASRQRRGRAAGVNLVPTSTGAALATAAAVPSIEGRFDGAAIRVPVAAGSIADIVAVTGRSTGTREIRRVLREEADGDRYRDVIGVTEDPLVSTDIVGGPLAALVDLTMTSVTGGDLVKVMAWYDNEWGYARQMTRQARAMVSSPVATR